MHVQHLAVMFDGRWSMLLGIVRLLEDGEGVSGTTLFEVHIRIHDDDVVGGNCLSFC
jgi:hypothetical protein